LSDISNGRQFGVIVGVQSLRRCSGTASAAADQSDLNGIRNGLGGDDAGKSSHEARANDLASVLNERAAIDR
jgi:hypothetical protein